MTDASQPLTLFISYSHEDDKWRAKLDKHLALLKRQGVFDVWHDRRIGAGREWAGEIDDALEGASVVLLLVSSDFLASDYCYDKEMKRALQRHDERTARVVPVILRKCDWQWSDFGKLQAVPRDGQPIASHPNVDEAMTEVSQALRKVAEDMRPSSAAMAGPPPRVAVLRAESDAAQSPALIIGEGWYGAPLISAAGPSLRQVFKDITLTYKELRPYVQRALPSASVQALPESLDAAFELLAGLPEDEAGMPPLWDFAERVARAQPLQALRTWLDHHLSAQQRAEMEYRLADAPCRARLLLWYRDDVTPNCMEGELQVLDVGAGVRTWPRQPARPVTREAVPTVVGQWLQAVFDHVGQITPDLVIELYLPRALLTAETYDTATVPLGEDVWRLGEDDPALLRCTDRYKARSKRKRLLCNAPGILARLGTPGGTTVLWAQPGDTAQDLKAAFIQDRAAAPVWLGFDCAASGDDEPLRVALDEGLPAVLWLRAAVDLPGRLALQADLDALLGAPLDALPQRLRKFRAHPPSPAARHVSLLLDDPARLPALLTTWSQPPKINAP